MSNSTLITDYIGRGTHANRPVTPGPIPTGCTALYYETDTTTLFYWSGAAWVQVGGGYSAGTVPTVVQTAFSVNGTNSAVFGVAPTNGNLLVAMWCNPTSATVGAGWTSQVTNSTGTDFSGIYTKVAGAGESTTQTPLGGVSTTGGMVIWEIAGANATPFVGGVSQAEQSGLFNTPNLLPGCSSCLGLAACISVTTPTITKGLNAGTQDVLDNSGTRKIFAGHTDLSKTPLVGVVAVFSATASSKSLSCLITS